MTVSLFSSVFCVLFGIAACGSVRLSDTHSEDRHEGGVNGDLETCGTRLRHRETLISYKMTTGIEAGTRLVGAPSAPSSSSSSSSSLAFSA